METQRLPEGVELSYTDRAVHLTTNGALYDLSASAGQRLAARSAA